METPLLCGETLTSLVNVPLPFILAETLDFYDGAISGILQCRDCPIELYTFEMLDWCYNYPRRGYDHSTRIYALAPCCVQDLEEVREICQKELPHPQDAPDLWEARSQTLERILKGTLPYYFVAAWNLYTDRIVALQRLTPELLAVAQPLPLWEDEIAQAAQPHNFDWFDFLGISQQI